MTLIAAMAIGASAMAQDTNDKQERKSFDPKEMIQQRTDETVKKYGLNEEQAAKLLDLNTRYAEKMGPMMGGGPRGGKGGQRPQTGERPQRQDGDTVKHQRRARPEMGGNREEMKKNFEAYDAELKTIMTEEQYNAYKKDMQNRRRGMGGRGPRQHKDNDNKD